MAFFFVLVTFSSHNNQHLCIGEGVHSFLHQFIYLFNAFPFCAWPQIRQIRFLPTKGSARGRQTLCKLLHEDLSTAVNLVGRNWEQVTGIQFGPVAQLCPTLCDPMNRSTPGLPVHHQLPEFTQTHIHRVGEAIQPSHPLSSPSPPLSSPSPPTFNLSQHQGLFQGVSSSHQVAKYWSFNFIISPSSEYSGLISVGMDWLDLPAVQGILENLLHTTVQNYQCFSAQLSL